MYRTVLRQNFCRLGLQVGVRAADSLECLCSVMVYAKFQHRLRLSLEGFAPVLHGPGRATSG